MVIALADGNPMNWPMEVKRLRSVPRIGKSLAGRYDAARVVTLVVLKELGEELPCQIGE